MTRKTLLVAIAAILCAGDARTQSSYATRALFANYDLDSTTAISCVLGTERPITQTISTSGSSTTVAAAVASSGPFETVAVGDVIYVFDSTNIRRGRLVTARASANSITVDTAINITPAQTFRTRTRACGTTATDGWFSPRSDTRWSVTVQVDQLSVASGGVGVQLQCKYGDLSGLSTAVNFWPGENSSDAHCNGGTFSSGYCVYTTAGIGARMDIGNGGVTFPDQCRVVMILTGTDDAGDLTTDLEKITAFVTETKL